MDSRNVVKKHIESFFQDLDDTKRSSSSPVANFFWNRINLLKSKETNTIEKLKQISQYIEALEKNIMQQENTIKDSNRDSESIKSQLKQALTENINLKTSFNRKTAAHTQLLKEKDENLIRLTTQMQSLQQQLDEIRQLYNKDSKAEIKSTKTVPELNTALEEFKVTQLKEFTIIFREFENEISNSWIEKMKHFENTLQKAVKITQQTSSNNHDKRAHLNGSFRKGNVPIKANNKVIGDKEEAPGFQ